MTSLCRANCLAMLCIEVCLGGVSRKGDSAEHHLTTFGATAIFRSEEKRGWQGGGVR